MERRVVLLLVVILTAVLVFACNKKACERFCDCDEIGLDMGVFDDYDDYDDYNDPPPDRGDCLDACEEMLDDANPACRFSFRSAARCLDKTGCDEADCIDQISEAELNCYLNL